MMIYLHYFLNLRGGGVQIKPGDSGEETKLGLSFNTGPGFV